MAQNIVSGSDKRPHIRNDQRFPRIYKVVERVLKDVKDNKASVKNVLYSRKIPKKIFQKVYGLTYNVLKHNKVIQSIIKETELLKKEPGIRQEAAEIMIFDMVIRGSNLPGESKPVLIIQKYYDEMQKIFAKLQNQPEMEHFIESQDKKYQSIPRYARIHTLSISVSDALEDLRNNGFERVDYDTNISLDEYQNLVLSLEPGQFLVDYHFNDVLVFQSGENLSYLNMYTAGQLFLQDKTSYVPVHVLAPEPGSTVLDCCAAPGMKTAHLASVMNNKGLIYAFDRDKERFKTLKSTINCAGVSICKASCRDFTSVDPNVEPYCSVDYILLDPSCSGSGMVSRMDEVTDRKDSKTIERLTKLAGFQIILLKHALSFPNVKRVVYSTCSVMEEENEYVVEEALNQHNRNFRLVPVFPEWPVRGSTNYKNGKLFFRSLPQKNLTNGFFVAMFERLQSDSCYKNKKSHNFVQGVKNEFDSSHKRKKYKHLKDTNCDTNELQSDISFHGVECVPDLQSDSSHKKKSHKYLYDEGCEASVPQSNSGHKKKKSHKTEQSEHDLQHSDLEGTNKTYEINMPKSDSGHKVKKLHKYVLDVKCESDLIQPDLVHKKKKPRKSFNYDQNVHKPQGSDSLQTKTDSDIDHKKKKSRKSLPDIECLTNLQFDSVCKQKKLNKCIKNEQNEFDLQHSDSGHKHKKSRKSLPDIECIATPQYDSFHKKKKSRKPIKNKQNECDQQLSDSSHKQEKSPKTFHDIESSNTQLVSNTVHKKKKSHKSDKHNECDIQDSNLSQTKIFDSDCNVLQFESHHKKKKSRKSSQNMEHETDLKSDLSHMEKKLHKDPKDVECVSYELQSDSVHKKKKSGKSELNESDVKQSHSSQISESAKTDLDMLHLVIKREKEKITQISSIAGCETDVLPSHSPLKKRKKSHKSHSDEK